MIEAVAEWQLSARDEAQIAHVIEESFPTEYGGRSFYQQRPSLRVVWRQQGIVAQISIFYRAIRLDKALSNVVGIGDVACLPEYRGQGIATALMDRALSIAVQSQADFALLFGQRGLYDRAGFVASPNPYTCVDMPGAHTGDLARREANFLMVRPLRDRVWPRNATVDFLGPLF